MNSKFIFYLYASCLVGVGLFLFVLYGATGHSFDFEEAGSLSYFIFSISFLSTSFLFLVSSFFVKWKIMFVITKLFLSLVLCLLLFLLGVVVYLSIQHGFVLAEFLIVIFILLLIYVTIQYLLKRRFWTNYNKALK